MKVAIFKNMGLGFESVAEKTLEGADDYVRITEYVDVKFTPLKNADVANSQIALLNAAKKKIQAETEIKLGELDHRIGELLALPQSV